MWSYTLARLQVDVEVVDGFVFILDDDIVQLNHIDAATLVEIALDFYRRTSMEFLCPDLIGSVFPKLQVKIGREGDFGVNEEKEAKRNHQWHFAFSKVFCTVQSLMKHSAWLLLQHGKPLHFLFPNIESTASMAQCDFTITSFFYNFAELSKTKLLSTASSEWGQL